MQLVIRDAIRHYIRENDNALASTPISARTLFFGSSVPSIVEMHGFQRSLNVVGNDDVQQTMHEFLLMCCKLFHRHWSKLVNFPSTTTWCVRGRASE